MFEALSHAAKTRGLRLTPARVRALELLGEVHRAMGAYELLDRLRAEGPGSQPPVVYLALEFLIRVGFAHKIEWLNAYIACCSPEDEEGHGSGHGACFLICSGCCKVAEIEDPLLETALASAAAGRVFVIGRTVPEIEGTFQGCRAASRTAAPCDRGARAGPLGCFVVWRRMAYFGDTVAHAALLGVALALALEIDVIPGVLAVAMVVVAALIGAAAALGGFRLSWVADATAGPSMVVTELGLFLLCSLLRRA